MHKEIIKFIVGLLIFALVTIIPYSILTCLWGEFLPAKIDRNILFKVGTPGHSFTRFKDADNFGSVDILFIGSSHAYRGFDTRIFEKYGYKSYNLGSSSQTPTQTLMLVRRYLDIMKPKIVIYEVYPVSFTVDGVESAIDLIANDNNDVNSIAMATNINKVKVYNSLIYSFYKQFNGDKAKFTEEAVKNNGDTFIKGGYDEREPEYWSVVPQKKIEFEFKKYQLRCFKKVCNEVTKRGIRLVLVETPVSKTYYNSYLNHNKFVEKLNSYPEFYNFNELMELNDSLHFSDAHHLNQHGVNLFDEKLIEIVLKK